MGASTTGLAPIAYTVNIGARVIGDDAKPRLDAVRGVQFGARFPSPGSFKNPLQVRSRLRGRGRNPAVGAIGDHCAGA